MLAFRSGSDQAHFTTEYVQHLRQFINAPFSHGLSPPGDAKVVFGRKGGARFFRIIHHGAELMDAKFLSFKAGPFLGIKYGPLRPDFYTNGRIQQEWRKDNEGQYRNQDIKESFDVHLPFGHQPRIDIAQYRAEQIAGFYRTRKDVEYAGNRFDINVFFA